MDDANQTKENDKPLYKKWWFWVGGLVLLLLSIGLVDTNNTTEQPHEQQVTQVSDACAEAFANAANVSDLQDTHEDLFPAYSACESVEEWKTANELHPKAIDGVDPVFYAQNVCANNPEQLEGTPICEAVKESNS